MQLDTQEIQKILPHRYPFLMIDKVIELEPNIKLVAVKNVSVNEQYFEGHFPDEKVMPGVLITEAMAQAACIYFYYSKNKIGKKLKYYLGRTTTRFLERVCPGDQLKVVVSSVKLMDDVGFVKAEASVDSKMVAEGEIVFSIKEV